MTEKWKPTVSDEELEGLFHKYCNDFTQLERMGRYDPITGRDKEVDETILIMLQKGRKNVCVLAPAGVGKTALVVGLAQRIVKNDVPDLLKGSRVLEVDLARMAAGTTGPADFQARFIPLCKGVAERSHNPKLPRIILFLDEIHQIMPTCLGSSYKGLSDVMKPYLTVGDLIVIGATTLDEFRMYVALDPAMDRRFQKVFLVPPTAVETYRILQAIRPGFEKHHKVRINNDQLLLITRLTEEHMRKRNQPDKSIITMDAAMACFVQKNGINQDIDLDCIYYMIGRETGLNRNALHDENKWKEICAEVKQLESGIAGEEPQKQKEDAEVPYNPASGFKDNKEKLKELEESIEKDRKKS